MISRTTIALLAAALLALFSHAAPADVSLPPLSLNGWLPSFAVRYDSAGAPASGGANYAVGDTITLSTAGGSCSTAPVLSVYTLSGSAIATFGVQNPGVCASVPAGPLAQASTSGSGSGATFTLKWAPIPYTQFENSVAQTVWLGPGAGSGITSGVSEIGIGYGACFGVTTGNENFCFGTLVGQSIGSGQFNVLIAGGPTIAGSSNTCVGVDSCRSATSGGLITAIGTSALKNQAASGGNGFTAVGTNAMLNESNANSSNDSTAIGYQSCRGAVGTASFRQGTCLGADNGNALTSANTFTFVGRNIGNTTFSNGTDVLLLDSGNNNVDTPAGNSSHMLNVAKVIAGDTAGATNPSVCAVGMKCLLGVLRGANFNSASDQAITIRPLTTTDTGYLASATKYKLQEIWVTNCSASLTTAKGGFYTAASKGGTIIGATTTAFTGCTGGTALQLLTALANMDTATYTAATLFLSLTTAQGGAATGDVYVFGTPVN